MRALIEVSTKDLKLDDLLNTLAARLTAERGHRVYRGDVLAEALREFDANHPAGPAKTEALI